MKRTGHYEKSSDSELHDNKKNHTIDHFLFVGYFYVWDTKSFFCLKYK